MLNRAGADGMRLEMYVNLKRNPSGVLVEGVKDLLRNMRSINATTAKAIVKENGITHAIDLVADRLSTTISYDGSSRFPTPETMYALIDSAKDECREAINGYLGTPRNTIG